MINLDQTLQRLRLSLGYFIFYNHLFASNCMRQYIKKHFVIMGEDLMLAFSHSTQQIKLQFDDFDAAASNN